MVVQILGQTDIDPAPRGTILFCSPVAFFYLWFVVDTVCVLQLQLLPFDSRLWISLGVLLQSDCA